MSLIIRNLSKSYPDKVLFADLCYEFNDKGLYVINGDSGTGKTTLLRIISGIDKKYRGEVVGGGKENVSFCFQEYRLFDSLNALENITEVSFKNADEEDIKLAKEILLRLRLSEGDLNLFPRELSGGMKQRVAFARAVLKASPILILDEPTKEVDESIREIMKEIIKEESAKRLVLLVTHKDEDLIGLEYKKITISA